MSGFFNAGRRVVRFAQGEWDEEKHPRDGGKFAPKEGAGGESGPSGGGERPKPKEGDPIPDPLRNADGSYAETTEEYYGRIAGPEHAFLVRTKGKPGHIYRGISGEELRDIHDTGRIKSKGELNVSDAENGTTLYSESPQTALNYQTSFAPADKRLKPGRPAYVIEVKRGTDDAVDVPGGARGDHAIPGDVPSDLIARVWELDAPYEEAPFPHIQIRQTGIEAGGSAVPARTAPANSKVTK